MTQEMAATSPDKQDGDIPPVVPPANKSTDTLCSSQQDLRWGCGPCRPSCMQRMCNNPKAFLLWLCWFSLLQGFVVNGINNVNVSTFERRFNLQSKESSLMSSFYDLSAGIFVIPFSYWGAHAHQPRLLAFAAIVMACGSLVMQLPQWTTDTYQLGNAIAEQCDPSGANNTNYCETMNDERYLSNYLYVFLLGQFLHGIGGTILYTLGIVFIDAHVSNTDSPCYQGIMYACSTLGPALGYIIGGQLLTIYVDIGRVDLSTITVTVNDPRWVGAWWIGFLATGFLLITVFFALLPYQRELPDKREVDKFRVSQAHDDGSNDITSKEGFGKTLKDLPISFKLLVCNPVFTFLAFAAVTEGAVTSGFATFIAKFIESQYGYTVGMAAMIGGGVAVPGAALGQLFGGLICKVMNLRVKGTIRLCMISSAITILLVTSCLASCSTPNIAGVVVNYTNTSVKLNEPALEHQCNDLCECTSRSYEPICGRNGIQYFSACHAGCEHSDTDNNGNKVYANCSCIDATAPAAKTWDHPSKWAHAAPGKCAYSCSMQYVFLPFFCFVILCTFLASVPAMNVSIRCVPDSQRSFALGVKWVFVRFLGTVPGPVIFGALFDRTCLIWQDKCGSRGACWIYDNGGLSLNLFMAAIVLKCLSFVFFTAAYFAYKPPKDGGVRGKNIKDGSEEVTPNSNQNASCLKSSPSVTPNADMSFDNPQFVPDNESVK